MSSDLRNKIVLVHVSTDLKSILYLWLHFINVDVIFCNASDSSYNSSSVQKWS